MVMFMILLDAVFDTAPHPLYNGYSIVYGFLASLLLFLLSFGSSVVYRPPQKKSPIAWSPGRWH